MKADSVGVSHNKVPLDFAAIHAAFIQGPGHICTIDDIRRQIAGHEAVEDEAALDVRVARARDGAVISLLSILSMRF